MIKDKKEQGRIKRHGRIRKKMIGTAERPRLAVHRSSSNIYAQVIDDTQSKTLFSFATTDDQDQDEIQGLHASSHLTLQDLECKGVLSHGLDGQLD